MVLVVVSRRFMLNRYLTQPVTENHVVYVSQLTEEVAGFFMSQFKLTYILKLSYVAAYKYYKSSVSVKPNFEVT
jgi:hypothetical protein